MCADKEGALCARIDELESKVAEVEEELQKFKDLEAKTQQAGCDTNDVRAKLSFCDSSLEQLQGELVACGEAMAEVRAIIKAGKAQAETAKEHAQARAGRSAQRATAAIDDEGLAARLGDQGCAPRVEHSPLVPNGDLQLSPPLLRLRHQVRWVA